MYGALGGKASTERWRWRKMVLIRAAVSLLPLCEIQHASYSPGGSTILHPGLTWKTGKEFKLHSIIFQPSLTWKRGRGLKSLNIALVTSQDKSCETLPENASLPSVKNLPVFFHENSAQLHATHLVWVIAEEKVCFAYCHTLDKACAECMCRFSECPWHLAQLYNCRFW